MSNHEQWQQAQLWEKNWWETVTANCTNTHDEEVKQMAYAQLMGLVIDEWGRIDLRGKSVLDIGGGPCSLLLKTINRGDCVVLDPLEYPGWVLSRYDAAGIEYDQYRAEDAGPYLLLWDEVWLYNVLEHVDDPELVLRNAMKFGKVLRVFEWVDNAVSDGHPHEIRQEWLESILGPGIGTSIRYANGVTRLGWSKVFTAQSVNHPAPLVLCGQKEKMTFHIPAIPHTVTSNRFVSCAYTQKVRKLCRMLSDLGHEVYHYGCEGSDVVCTEDVPVVSDAYRQKFYPDAGIQQRQYSFDIGDEYHREFSRAAADAVKERLGDRDLLLCAWGLGHKPIAEILAPAVEKRKLRVVESGIGYESTFAPLRVFESYAWMHYLYGKDGVVNGKFYDAVIPNYFDPSEFTFSSDKDDFFLYIGRLVGRKGIGAAVEMTKRLGVRLVVAGQGSPQNSAEGVDLSAGHVEFVGYADVTKRRELMSRARCLIAPTYYIEPFGGVAVEAQLSGTPVICTDWGAFSETVLHGVTGYRCRTMEQFVWAGRNIGSINSLTCYDWAIRNYSMGRVALMYQEFFEMVYGLWGSGWPAANDQRMELGWLHKQYPL